MTALWRRLVRWLARKELMQLQLQLAILMAQNAMLNLANDLLSHGATLSESAKKSEEASVALAKQVEQLDKPNREDAKKKRTVH